ncbi:MAG: GntR family transcriptional regulator [Bacillota bacterium]|nr:GntR family transcriptional regulator [Bacillota bacterium]
MQIILHIKRGAAAGTVKDGDELPSRRMLSALLGVNPNTVQKAYRMLEEENLVSSHSGAKSVMILNEEKKEKIRTELLENDIKNVIQSMQQMGISKEEALHLIDIYWR